MISFENSSANYFLLSGESNKAVSKAFLKQMLAGV